MRKGLLIAVALVVASGSAFATVSRDQALSANGWMVADDANVSLLPTTVLGYKDLVIGELASGPALPNNNYAVVNMGMGPGMLSLNVGNIGLRGAGVGLVTGAGAGTAIIPGTMFAASSGVANAGMLTIAPQGRIGVLYAQELDKNLSIAGGVEYAAQSSETKNVNTVGAESKEIVTKQAASVINVVGGVSLPLAILDPLEIGAVIGLPSFDATTTDDQVVMPTEAYFKSDGGMDIQLAARGKMPGLMGKNIDSYAMVMVSMANLKAKSGGSDWVDGTEEGTSNAIGLGWANNIAVSDSTLLVVGAALMQATNGVKVVNNDLSGADPANDATTKTWTTMTSLPLTVAVETKVLPWIKGQLSSVSSLYNSVKTSGTYEEAEVANNEVKENYVVTETSNQAFQLGLEAALTEKLTLSACIAEDIAFTGPYFITGKPTATIATNVSLTQRF